MNPERLAEIRADIPRLHAMMGNCAAEECPASEDHTLVDYATELLAHVDDLARQLDDARRLALPAFVSAEGDESRLSHALNDTCEHCGTDLNEQACFRCGMNWPAPDPDTEAHISRLEEQAAGIRLAESL